MLLGGKRQYRLRLLVRVNRKETSVSPKQRRADPPPGRVFGWNTMLSRDFVRDDASTISARSMEAADKHRGAAGSPFPGISFAGISLRAKMGHPSATADGTELSGFVIGS